MLTDTLTLQLKSNKAEERDVPLKANSHLLVQYQQSLGKEQQAVLSRWRAGEFHAGDERATAAERLPDACNARADVCPVPHSHTFSKLSRDLEAEAEYEEEMETADSDEQESDE